MKAPITRIFQIVETTFADGTKKTRCEGDMPNTEVLKFLKNRQNDRRIRRDIVIHGEGDSGRIEK